MTSGSRSLLFADDVVLLAPSVCNRNRFKAECKAEKRKISPSKSEVMVLIQRKVEPSGHAGGTMSLGWPEKRPQIPPEGRGEVAVSEGRLGFRAQAAAP